MVSDATASAVASLPPWASAARAWRMRTPPSSASCAAALRRMQLLCPSVSAMPAGKGAAAANPSSMEGCAERPAGYASSPSSAVASLRSAVSKPSVNQL
jgi:hypothetical protein